MPKLINIFQIYQDTIKGKPIPDDFEKEFLEFIKSKHKFIFRCKRKKKDIFYKSFARQALANTIEELDLAYEIYDLIKKEVK